MLSMKLRMTCVPCAMLSCPYPDDYRVVSTHNSGDCEPAAAAGKNGWCAEDIEEGD